MLFSNNAFPVNEENGNIGTFQILDYNSHSERRTWLSIWESWAGREIYAHPDYVRLFAKASEHPICAAMINANGGGILYPLILRPLNVEPWTTPGTDVYDVVTPYGYGGAFEWATNQENANAFWTGLENWIKGKNVVSSFARLSLFSDQILAFPGDIEVRQSNVVRSLDLDDDALWRDYAHKVRKNVKRALHEKIEIEFDDDGQQLDSFLQIYYSTMDRNNASERYYFSESFFRQMIAALAGNFAFFHAIKSGKIISTELVLLSDKYIYSFLGGTLREAFQFRPNDLIKHRIIEWGRANGKKGYVLGGGYEGRDGIFRYKLSFAPNGEVPFRVGKKIHNLNLYQQLVGMREEWERSRNGLWNPNPEYFPKYRA